jgi:hypothetical protein
VSSPLLLYPGFYTPPGVEKPPHCPHRGPGNQLVAGQGPDGQGGRTHGCAYSPLTKGEWTKTAAGWWINFTNKRPANLLRAVTLPGRTVSGAEPEHLWVVPQILNRDMTCAIPQRFAILPDGSFGWADEPKYADLISTMRAIRLGEVKDDTLLIKTAVALLEINYYVTANELAAVGWMTNDMMFRVIVAAAGGESDGIL